MGWIDRLTMGGVGDVGCYTSFLSGVGVGVCHAVYSLAAGGKG